MQPVSRRGVLVLGGAGAASVALGAVGLSQRWLVPDTEVSGTDSGLSPVEGGEVVEPEVLRSQDGVLELQLDAAMTTHRLAGREATTLTFNGAVPGPTLRVRPGDTIRLRLANGLDEPTNLHVHGLHVSPEGNSDNVFLMVAPGDSFDYEYVLPGDHPPGTYWYHPHHHGTVADQLFGGLYGAIVVEGPSPVEASRERLLVVGDIALGSDGRVVQASMMDRMAGREGDLLLVNGQVEPRLAARPGEREHWRVVNACTSRFLSLRMAGDHDAQVLGRDIGVLGTPHDLGEGLLLAPGNRAELLVTVAPGEGALMTDPVDRGGMGMMQGSRPGGGGTMGLVVLEGSGESVEQPDSPPSRPGPRDLRGSPVDGSRTLTFAMGGPGGGRGPGGGPGMAFTIDGREFDADRTDQQVGLGTVEEWTVRNDSPMDHPFHLHVWPMQVVRDADGEVRDPLWLDVVNVPARSEVTVRIAFEDIPGRTVYHCHILDHEDLGMMGVIEAQP
ncbi:multicopper oxidase family protein [Ornithinimicrobium sediminis]|uniref:multicopper oxidase family protein n=1 Tax=Ornithinimicrobium sediminis TaxID=2904603 RepID=UPI001E503256|nr:multicopper oxidase family protein [Ornithinimicrobium sediminis]MCE0486332.1 multicopper oxidase family protein [Ornithinimicrobium sediminis]